MLELLTAADRHFTARNGEPGTAFGRLLAGAMKKWAYCGADQFDAGDYLTCLMKLLMNEKVHVV